MQPLFGIETDAIILTLIPVLFDVSLYPCYPIFPSSSFLVKKTKMEKGQALLHILIRFMKIL